MQIATGVGTNAISNQFIQGAITNTGTNTDLAVSGNGLFVVRDARSDAHCGATGAATFVRACLAGGAPQGSSAGNVSKQPFGTVDGQPIEIYTLRNSKGTEARIMTYGGIVQSLEVANRNGSFDDVVLGFDNVDDYVKSSPYFGCLVGRYGNRIGDAQFTVDGQTYQLAKNNNGNSLHGGVRGFDKAIWEVTKAEMGPDGPRLELNYLSKDGEEGFPGNLNVTATYTLTNASELRLDFKATTDKATVCNLTHHSYFNLHGQGNGDILGHELYINSDKTTPVNKDLITTGEYASVEGTPFDFRTPTTIGARIDNPDTQLQYGPGYDHNWVINKPPGKLGLQATVFEPTTGRVMEVISDEPAVQFYAGNFLDGTLVGKGNKVYQKRTGFCLEPQHYPDSPNKPQFPSVTLRPGETYSNTIIYKFSTK